MSTILVPVLATVLAYAMGYLVGAKMSGCHISRIINRFLPYAR